MQYTNKFNLPKPVVLLITTDLYNKKRDAELKAYCSRNLLDVTRVKHYSASDLIKPPRMRVLVKRHWATLITDVSTHIYRVLGQAIHYFLREAAIHGELEREGWKAEERMFAHFIVDGQTIVISGEPDIVDPAGKISDYKVCAVWSWMKEAKREWVEQTNIYAFLRYIQGLQTSGLEICYILRDFKVSETVQEGYPQAGAQMEDVILWSLERQKDFIMSRIKVHLASEDGFDEDLPECTAEEMWEKPDCWAVKRDGNKVASKVFSSKFYLEEGRKADPLFCKEDANAMTLHEAEGYAQTLNVKLKGKEADRKYFVEHRPGERTRCLRFCEARTVCNVFQEYASAAFSGRPSRETVEEIG
jgi:hypothetical protein